MQMQMQEPQQAPLQPEIALSLVQRSNLNRTCCLSPSSAAVIVLLVQLLWLQLLLWLHKQACQ
jgi:hypothetical protein